MENEQHWEYLENSKIQGPLRMINLIHLIGMGIITRHSSVRCVGSDIWEIAAKTELKEYFTTATIETNPPIEMNVKPVVVEKIETKQLQKERVPIIETPFIETTMVPIEVVLGITVLSGGVAGVYFLAKQVYAVEQLQDNRERSFWRTLLYLMMGIPLTFGVYGIIKVLKAGFHLSTISAHKRRSESLFFMIVLIVIACSVGYIASQQLLWMVFIFWVSMISLIQLHLHLVQKTMRVEECLSDKNKKEIAS